MKKIIKIFGIGAAILVILLTLTAAANSKTVDSYEKTNLLFTYRAAHAIGESVTVGAKNFLNQEYQQEKIASLESENSNIIILPTIMPTCMISCAGTCWEITCASSTCSPDCYLTINQPTCAPSTCSIDCYTTFEQIPTCQMYSCAATCDPTCLSATCNQFTCAYSCGEPLTICQITCGPGTCSPECYMTLNHPTCAPACQLYEYDDASCEYGIEI